jgi:hypothetical protein
LDGDAKADMFCGGSIIAARLKLSSKRLTYLLAELLEGLPIPIHRAVGRAADTDTQSCWKGYRYRYTELWERDKKIPGKLEAHEHHQAWLEGHKWLMDLLRDALKDEAWKASRDPSRKEQEVAILF